MTPQPDLSTWLTREQAAARLGIGKRTLDRETEAEHLHPRRDGKRSVFDPAELDAWAAARKPSSAVVVSSSPSPAPSLPAVANLPEAGISPDLLIMRLVEMVAASQKPPTTYVKLADASQETGLSHKFLRRQVMKGNLPAIRDVSIKVHREDLAELDLSSELIQPRKAKAKARK